MRVGCISFKRVVKEIPDNFNSTLKNEVDSAKRQIKRLDDRMPEKYDTYIKGYQGNAPGESHLHISVIRKDNDDINKGSAVRLYSHQVDGNGKVLTDELYSLYDWDYD